MADHPQDDGPQQQSQRPSPQHSGGERDGTPQAAEELVYLRSTKSLERLRDRVRLAAEEIIRLRDENAALAERLAELETEASIQQEGHAIRMDEDPEVLRRKVSEFIEAIDNYLNHEQKDPAHG